MHSCSSGKPVVLFIIGSLEIGGAEKQIVSLLNHIHDHEYCCYVFALQKDGPLKAYLEEHGVRIYEGGLKKGDITRAPWRLLFAEWKLLKIMLSLKPTIVQSFLPLVTFMGALAGCLAKVPLVITSRRALGKHQERHIVLRPFDLLANRLSHRVTVNSRAVWEDTVNRDHMDPAKLVLIYNGVDASSFDSARASRRETREKLEIRPKEKVIIAIGNLIPYKGHEELLLAAHEVLEEVPQAVFLLVGEERGIGWKLEKMAVELGISSRVKFVGLRQDIPQLLAASDVSVIASHEEGFSNVVLESMAAGLPVVATRVGGNSEAVIDAATGWLVPPRNPTAMAEKIIDLLNDPNKAESWGNMGRERVKEDFSLEKMVEEHMRLYSSTM